jgi:hypothetical protein
MAPELLRFSTSPEKAEKFAPHLRNAHRPSETAQLAPRAEAAAAATSTSLWEQDDGLAQLIGHKRSAEFDDDDDGDDLGGVLDGIF